MNFNASAQNYPKSSGRKLLKRPNEVPGLESSGPTQAPPPSMQMPYSPYPGVAPPGMSPYPPQMNMPQYPQQPMPMGGYGGGYMNPGAMPPGMAAGASSLLGDPLVANVAMHYGNALVDSGKQLVDREFEKYVPVTRLKYYFAVDTSYVTRKLKLLFFPFTHKDWSVKYEQSEPVQPRYEVNAPDLYIPTMAYVTYILVAGLALGTQNRFTPEILGIQASSALAWTIAEILVELVTLYITNIQTHLRALDLLAYSGYKFVGIIFAVLLSLLFQKTGYYVALVYSSFALAFFIMRTLKWQVLTEVDPVNSGNEFSSPDSYSHQNMHARLTGHKRRLYFLVSVAGVQPLLMWWLSSHLISSSIQ
ncbi:protein YIF1B [Nilaparvata lugens]|uniref:protein YIF1B n=1 Tax=Nilaparvata lugens TaxID=108931 RepID=UPI00193E47D5|nr:protein YIF1B [Nilaparvata lugens]